MIRVLIFFDRPHFLHLPNLSMSTESCICFKHSNAFRKYTCCDDIEAGTNILRFVGQSDENINLKKNDAL